MSAESESQARIEHRLLRIERLLEIGFAEQVDARRAIVGLDDEVIEAILARTAAWAPAGSLKREVVEATGRSAPTVKRRFKRLLEVGALESRGKTTSTEYRNTGLLG